MSLFDPSDIFMNVHSMVETIGQPTFLLDVEGPSKFRFRRLNKTYVDEIGLQPSMIVDRTPEEALDPRLAATVVENYERCRSSGAAIDYEEELCLKGKTAWWLTTLCPIASASGEVRMIMGIAIDITKRKEAEFTQASEMSRVQQVNRDLQMFASVAAQDATTPLETLVGLLDVLREGFLDMGDGKIDQMNLASVIATDAVEKLQVLIKRAGAIDLGEAQKEEVDVRHMCLDISAQIDPLKRTKIDLPSCKVIADPIALQMVTKHFMNSAGHYARSHVTVDIEQFDPEFLLLRFSDDGIGPDEKTRFDGNDILPKSSRDEDNTGLAIARQVITARGGSVTLEPSKSTGTNTIAVKLPGTIVA